MTRMTEPGGASVRAALDDADTPTLLMVLVHLTGEEEWLERFRPHIRPTREFANDIPATLEASLRDRLAAALDETSAPAALPSLERLKRMVDVFVGEDVPSEYMTMLIESSGLAPDAMSDAWRLAAGKDFKVAIVGAGVSGICAAVGLRNAGISFEIFERNAGVGGTWHENRYPGCGVDTPNHFYSYSFNLNPDWSRYFAKQQEIEKYLEDCVAKYSLADRIRLNSAVLSAEWDDARRIWALVIQSGDGVLRTVEVNAVISAVGLFSRPALPAIEGIERYEGPIFHTARWPDDDSWKGKHVAIIGTGASAIQLAPAIAAEVPKLTIFQRSPPWVVPRQNYHREVTEAKKWVLAHVPGYNVWYRFQLLWAYSDAVHPVLMVDPLWRGSASTSQINEQARERMVKYIRDQIGNDPELLGKVIPDYPPYGKRVLMDSHWYKTLKLSNVELVTTPIRRVLSDAIETTDGRIHPAEALMLATGFDARRMIASLDVRGRNGRSLRDLWGEEDARAYLGIGVSGFPNFFVLFGPNTNYAHGGSMVFNAECQTRYILSCLRHLIESGGAALDCREETYQLYNDRIDRILAGMVWSHKGVRNWMTNGKGRVVTNSPWRLIDYWSMTKVMDPKDWTIIV